MPRFVIIAVKTLLFLTISVSPGAFAESYSGGMPISPQPDSSTLSPGLAVKYFFDYFDHINELSMREGGKDGEPLKNIAHNTLNGSVLTTNRPMGVGAKIRGLIHLAEPGTYVFKIQSNDGIRAYIGGIKIWTDPEIHGHRWSRPLEYEVVEAGWYELKFDYYQRKGTSALQLTWITPGSQEEVIVPESALAY